MKRTRKILLVIVIMLSLFNLSNKISAFSQKSSLELLNEKSDIYRDEIRLSDLTATQIQELKEILLTNLDTKAVQLSKQDYVTKKTSLTTAEITKYFVPLVRKIRQDNPSLSPQEASRLAMEQAIDQANQELYQNVLLESKVNDLKVLFKKLLDNHFLATKPTLTIAQLKKEIHAIHRGLFYLVQNYNFDTDLAYTLVMNPQSFSNIAQKDNAYERLVNYGTLNALPGMNQTANQRVWDQFFKVKDSSTVYRNKIEKYTGLSLHELIEKLAANQSLSDEEYFNQQTKALLLKTDRVSSVYNVIKNDFPNLILPILSSGSKIYIAATSNGINVGQLDAYLNDYPQLKDYEHVQGTPQDLNIQTLFQTVLNQQENYWDFVRSTTSNRPLTKIIATDSMVQYNPTTNQISWGNETSSNAIRDFFIPLDLYPSYTYGSRIEGVSTGENSFTSYTVPLLGKHRRGLTLFSHESTHSKEKNIFGVRRLGQGPEVYARGLFEDLDNTQNGQTPYQPVMTLNTTLEIKDVLNRTQPKKPNTSKENLEKYTKNLIELVMYLEAVEAKIALELSQEDKNIYFNQVNQVSAQNDTARILGNTQNTSTNDRITFQNQTLSTISQLVDSSIISGQFIPKGVSPQQTIKHNDYVNVPLLNSFYAAPQQKDASMNAVGDVSFKRMAYEILAFKGFDAFVEYVGNGNTSDTMAFGKILQGSFNNEWSEFKKAKYTELLNGYKLINSDNIQFESELTEAIKKDLQVLKSFRSAVDLINATSDSESVKDTKITEKAVQMGLMQNTSNVRNVKLKVLQEAHSLLDEMKSAIQLEKLESKTVKVVYEIKIADGTVVPERLKQYQKAEVMILETETPVYPSLEGIVESDENHIWIFESNTEVKRDGEIKIISNFRHVDKAEVKREITELYNATKEKVAQLKWLSTSEAEESNRGIEAIREEAIKAIENTKEESAFNGIKQSVLEELTANEELATQKSGAREEAMKQIELELNQKALIQGEDRYIYATSEVKVNYDEGIQQATVLKAEGKEASIQALNEAYVKIIEAKKRLNGIKPNPKLVKVVYEIKIADGTAVPERLKQYQKAEVMILETATPLYPTLEGVIESDENHIWIFESNMEEKSDEEIKIISNFRHVDKAGVKQEIIALFKEAKEKVTQLKWLSTSEAKEISQEIEAIREVAIKTIENTKEESAFNGIKQSALEDLTANVELATQKSGAREEAMNQIELELNQKALIQGEDRYIYATSEVKVNYDEAIQKATILKAEGKEVSIQALNEAYVKIIEAKKKLNDIVQSTQNLIGDKEDNSVKTIKENSGNVKKDVDTGDGSLNLIITFVLSLCFILRLRKIK